MCYTIQRDMREWLSGRASPCQGERREFESRLPLHIYRLLWQSVFFCSKSVFRFHLFRKTPNPLQCVNLFSVKDLYISLSQCRNCRIRIFCTNYNHRTFRSLTDKRIHIFNKHIIFLKLL